MSPSLGARPAGAGAIVSGEYLGFAATGRKCLVWIGYQRPDQAETS